MLIYNPTSIIVINNQLKWYLFMRQLISLFLLSLFSMSLSANEIESGCYGGFSGGGGGLVFKQAGDIISWKMPTYSQPAIKTLLRHDPETTAALFNKLETIKFTTIQYDQPANMTCYIALKNQEKTIHRIRWPYGSAKAPQSVLDFYQELNHAAQQK